MSMKYSVVLPQMGMQMKDIKDPVEAFEAMIRVAQTAEECGYEAVWLADHFMPMVQEVRGEGDWFECWTSTAALARETKRVRIGQAMTCNGYRNPALLAKMASTVDVLSHGRLILGIGSGDFEREFRAYGYACPPAPERLRQMGEAVQIILAMWTQDEATFEGTYYQVHGAINQPKGVQRPHILLLIGGSGEKVTLKLVAQYADACDIFGDLATITRKLAVLKAHCEAVGRDYESIHRMTRTMCIIAETDEQALASIPEEVKAHIDTLIRKEEWHGAIAIAPTQLWSSFLGLVGSPETIRQQIAAYEAAGVQEMRLIFPDAVHLESIRRFAKEFIV
jgi:F420-dependent oxidoreductase-like protein